MNSPANKSVRNKIILAGVIVLLVLAIDQFLKFWVKTNMTLGVSGEIPVFGDWFKLHFTENEGMAFGLKLPGHWGKLILTVFRIIAVTGIIYYLRLQAKALASNSTIVLLALILGGAMGNIIDSVFYGQWFTDSVFGLAQWAQDGNGYASYFHGKVVDMFYFPIIHGTYPDWVPWKGGESFTFFSAIFNVADAAISIGLISILLFKRSLFNGPVEEVKSVNQTEDTIPSSDATE